MIEAEGRRGGWNGVFALVGLSVARMLRWLNRKRRSRTGRKLLARLGRRLIRRGFVASDVEVGNGFRMTLHLNSYLESAIYFDAFEHTTCQVLSTVLRSGDVFVDVGANVGFFSLMAARLVGDQGRVISFEPNSAACATFRQACDRNQCNEIVEIHDYGLSDVAGMMLLHVPRAGDSGLASLRPAPGRPSYQSRVMVRRLDDEAFPPGTLRLMKIDVEGAELAVLRGARRLLEHFRPHVICEANPERALAFGYDPSDIVRYLVQDVGEYQLNLLTSRRILYNVQADVRAVRVAKLENLWFSPCGSGRG